MKVKVYLKDPDGFLDGVKDSVRKLVGDLGGKLTSEEKDIIVERRSQEALEFMSQWVEYDECVLLEFDTDAKTATVVKLPGA
jgi:hypothetical protein